MVPTLPLWFNSTEAAQWKLPTSREACRSLFQIYPLHPLFVMAGVTRITTENFQELSEFSQVVQRF